LPPFNYDLDFPIIQGRGYNNQKSSKFMKHWKFFLLAFLYFLKLFFPFTSNNLLFIACM
jgi:hypothetical protein